MSKPLRFHWSMSSAGEELKGAKARAAVSGVPDLDAHIEFCKHAAACGIEHLLTAFGFHRADPIALAAALSMKTEKVNFLVATRSGLTSPTLFAQQVNSVSALSGGRICINMVAGHSPKEFKYYGDFLSPDKRYDRTDEFLTICRAFWESTDPVNFIGEYYKVEEGVLNTPFVAPARSRPEIYLGGKSERAFELAAKHASCLLTLPDTPEVMQPKIQSLTDRDTEVGLLVSILARPSREDALYEAYDMIGKLGHDAINVHKEFKKGSVSEAFNSILNLGENEEDWMGPCLWTGAIPYMGAPAIALVGSYDEVAQTIINYKNVGISQFLFLGWPDINEMTHFGSEVLPRVRSIEQNLESGSTNKIAKHEPIRNSREL